MGAQATVSSRKRRGDQRHPLLNDAVVEHERKHENSPATIAYSTDSWYSTQGRTHPPWLGSNVRSAVADGRHCANERREAVFGDPEFVWDGAIAR